MKRKRGFMGLGARGQRKKCLKGKATCLKKRRGMEILGQLKKVSQKGYLINRGKKREKKKQSQKRKGTRALKQAR